LRRWEIKHSEGGWNQPLDRYFDRMDCFDPCFGGDREKSSKNYNPPIPFSKRERGIIKSDNPQDGKPF
jgi:hypothetical protein